MVLMTLLVLPTTIEEHYCGAFSCEDGCNGNGYDVSVDIGVDNKNFIFFKSRLRCQIIAVDFNYDDEFHEVT